VSCAFTASTLRVLQDFGGESHDFRLRARLLAGPFVARLGEILSSSPNLRVKLARPGFGPALKRLGHRKFGGRHAARVFSRAAVRGAHIASRAPRGFGTRDLAVQLTRDDVRWTN